MDIIKSIKIVVLGVFCALSISALPALAETEVQENVIAVESTAIDINTADAELLADVLAGVGKTKADAIVAYRADHGQFASVDALIAVKGIGQATVDKNREKMRIN